MIPTSGLSFDMTCYFTTRYLFVCTVEDLGRPRDFRFHLYRSGISGASRVEAEEAGSDMRVRILKVPPAPQLEGVEMGALKLRRGETRSLRTPIAAVLIAWGYAEAVETAGSAVRPARKRARDRKP